MFLKRTDCLEAAKQAKRFQLRSVSILITENKVYVIVISYFNEINLCYQETHEPDLHIFWEVILSLLNQHDFLLAVLLHILQNLIKPSEQTLIFTATKHHVEYLKEV